MKKRRLNYLKSNGGFTVIELVVIVAAIGILSAVAIVRFSASESTLIKTAANVFISDVNYAQELAKNTNKGTKVVIIQDTDPTPPPAGQCFVATVCYSQDAYQVNVLRRVRDQALQNNPVGRSFIRWYYSHGPALADFVSEVDILRGAARAILLPIVLISSPFVGPVFAGGGGGDGGGGEEDIPNSYYIKYQDNTLVTNPRNGEDYYIFMGDRISITSTSRTVYFDGSGMMTVSGYGWGANETSMIICSFNDNTHINISRHTGKMWVE